MVDAYFSGKNKRRPLIALVRIIFPFVFFAIGIAGIIIVADKMDTSSGFMRLDNTLTGIKAFLAHPILGVGLENEEALNTYANYKTFSEGLAMGIPVLLGEGGIMLSSLYLFAGFHGIFVLRKKTIMICFVFIHFLILLTSNIPYFPSTVMVLAIELSSRNHRTAKFYWSAHIKEVAIGKV